jgi:hypothetical protein
VLQQTSNPDSYTIGQQGTYDELMATTEFASLMDAFHRNGKETKKSDNNDDMAAATIRAMANTLPTSPTLATLTAFDAKDTSGSGHGHSNGHHEELMSPTLPTSSLMKKKLSVNNMNVNTGEHLIDEEQRLSGSATLRDILNHFLGSTGPMGIISVFLLAASAQSVLTTADFMLARWTNHVIENEVAGVAPPDPIPNMALYGGLIIGVQIILSLRSKAIVYVTIGGNRHLHRSLLTGVMGRTMAWFERTPTGRILNRFTKDMYVVDQEIGSKGDNASASWTSVLGSIIVCGIVAPPALAVVALLAYGNYWVTRYYCNSYREIHRLESLTR